MPRGECRVGLGGGTAGRRGTVRLRSGTTRVTGTCQEAPDGCREADFGKGGRRPVTKPKVLGGLSVGKVQGQSDKVLRVGEGGQVLGVGAKYCGFQGVHNVLICCVKGELGAK